MFSLAGPGADALLHELHADSLVGSPPGSHALLNFGGSPVMLSVGSGLAGPGYTLIADETVAGDLWRTLAAMVRSTIVNFDLNTRTLGTVSLHSTWQPGLFAHKARK